MKNIKNEILRLRSEGKTYKEIMNELQCSKGLIAYHCGDGQKEKHKQRMRTLRENLVFRKSRVFKERKASKGLENRIDLFQRGKREKGYERKQTFHWKEVIDKFGTKTKCYLTGEEIDLNNVDNYSFDHKIPKSKGGSNSLENLGICTKEANQSKTNLTVDEYITLCKKVLEYNGYKVEKK